MTGTKLKNGEYTIEKDLGTGGEGAVYLARNRVGKPFAMKTLNSNQLAGPRERERFESQAKRLVELSQESEYLVEVMDYFVERWGPLDVPCMVMEYLAGGSLGDQLKAQPRGLPVTDVLRWMVDVTEGLEELHRGNILHRDLKPANILLRRKGKRELAVVTDFGLMADLDETSSGNKGATPGYFPPEQWKLRTKEQDQRLDLYALGMTMYRLLTGKWPYEFDSAENYYAQLGKTEPVAPSRWREELRQWEGLDQLVLDLIAVDRGKRPPDAQTVRTRLEALRQATASPSGEPTKKRPLPPLEKPPGGRVWVWALGLVMAVAVGVTAVQLWRPGANPGLVGPPAVSVPPTVTPAARKAGDTRVNPKDGLTYVWIPPGRFRIGCSAGDTECDSDEKPARDVEIEKGFWLGESEVTQGAYERVIGKKPSHFQGAKKPVENVSWEEAKRYCELVGGRLPREAEWEYAARGGSNRARYGELEKIGWYEKNSGGETHEVKQKVPNGFGLYDMLGNVWEWVDDWYDKGWYAKATGIEGPPSGGDKVLRGGSWVNSSRVARASNRYDDLPEERYNVSGFRCAGDSL